VTYRVVFTPTARTDVLHAFHWIAERSPDAADRWLSGLEKAIGKLSTFPERHPVAGEESEQFGFAVRQMLYGRRRGIYRVLFSVRDETVYLHYARHGAQGPMEF
jgi:plasmid stabilization system protein ParE